MERQLVAFPKDIPEASMVSSLHLDRQGVLWAASLSGLYRRGTDGSWTRLTVQDDPIDFINAVVEDPGGGLWICTRLSGFGRMAGTIGNRLVLDPKFGLRDGLPDRDVRTLWFGSDGRRWAGTSSGLVDWSSASRLQILTAKDGLSDDSIYALMEDPAQNLWIGTRRGGVMRMGLPDWKTFGRADGLSLGHDEMIMNTRAGEVCIADLSDPRRALRCQEGDHFATFIPPLPKKAIAPNSSEMVLQDHVGGWWISTGSGVFRYAPAERAADLARMRPSRLRPDLQTTRLFEDSRGDVWIASITAKVVDLLRWERGSENVYDESQAMPALDPRVRVSAFAEDRSGQLWIGLTQGGGLLRRRNGHFESVSSALAGRINELYVDHLGRLWIASVESGLGRIDQSGADAPTMQVLTTSQRLASNEIWCIVEDHLGRIYAGNARGVDRIDPSSGEVLHYSEADGLVKGDIRSAIRDTHGDLWFASNRGASRVRPSADLKAPPPAVRITALRVDGNPWPGSDPGETELGPLEFSPRQNSLTVEFGAIDYSTSIEFAVPIPSGGRLGRLERPHYESKRHPR